MKIKFTKTYVINHRGCYNKEQVLNLSFINKRIIKIEDIINSEIPYKDKIFFIWVMCEFNYKEKLELYNNSEKIQKILSKYYSNASGWRLHSCSYFSYLSFGEPAYTKSEQNIILQEILEYSKKFKT